MATDIASIGIRVETRGVDQGIKSLDSLASQGKRTEQAVNSLGNSAQKNSEAFKRAASSIDDVNSSAKGLGSSLSKVAALGAGGILGSAFVGQVKEAAVAIFQASSQLERFKTGLNFASGGKGTQELEYLRGVTQKLGLEFASTAQAYTGFSAAARGTALEGQKARDVFESIAKASAVMGLSTDQTSGVLLALQQMISKGTVQAEELRGQLGERLPGAFQIAARAMGVTTAELGKMLEQGKVVADDFLPKFAAALNESLGNAAESAANRLDASVNRFNNAWDRLKSNIGDAGPARVMANQIDILSDAFGDLNTSMAVAKAEGDGFAGQTIAAAGAVLRFLNPLNAISYSAQDVGTQLNLAQKSLADLEKQGAKSSSNLQLRETYNYTVRLIEKLEQAKRAQDALLLSASQKGQPQDFEYNSGSSYADYKANQAAAKAYTEENSRLTKTQRKEKEIADARKKNSKALEQAGDNEILQNKVKASLLTEIANIEQKYKEPKGTSASTGVSEIASIQARVFAVNQNIEALKKYGSAADKITEGEKLAYKIQQEIDSGKLKSSQLLVKQKELEAAKSLQSAQESLIAEEKRLKGQKLTNELLQDSIGYNEDFIEQWNLLSAAYDGTEEGLRRLTAAQAKLIADQPFSKMERSIAEARNEMELFEQSLTRASQRELEQIGVGGIPLQRMQRQNQVDDQIRSRREQLASNKARDTASAGGTLPENLAKYYETQEQAITDMYSRITLANSNAFDQMLAKQGDWQNGAKAAFEDYAATVQNVAQQTNDLFSSAFSSMESALVNFITTGKFEFKSFATSIIADLAKIEAKKLILSAATGLRSILGFADGGYTGDGGKYEAAGIVHRGEVVWSQSDVARAGGVNRVESMRLRGYANGGIVGQSSSSSAPASSGNVSVMVNIEQGGGATVDTKAQGEQARKLGDLAGVAVRDALMRERRQGGILWNMKNGR